MLFSPSVYNLYTLKLAIKSKEKDKGEVSLSIFHFPSMNQTMKNAWPESLRITFKLLYYLSVCPLPTFSGCLRFGFALIFIIFPFWTTAASTSFLTVTCWFWTSTHWCNMLNECEIQLKDRMFLFKLSLAQISKMWCYWKLSNYPKVSILAKVNDNSPGLSSKLGKYS